MVRTHQQFCSLGAGRLAHEGSPSCIQYRVTASQLASTTTASVPPSARFCKPSWSTPVSPPPSAHAYRRAIRTVSDRGNRDVQCCFPCLRCAHVSSALLGWHSIGDEDVCEMFPPGQSSEVRAAAVMCDSLSSMQQYEWQTTKISHIPLSVYKATSTASYRMMHIIPHH